MFFIDPKDKRAEAVTAAIRAGNVRELTGLLAEHPELTTAHIGDASEGRTLLHILADWPGHLPNNEATAKALLDAGANINAEFVGELHSETALHWAASNDDVGLLDVLLDAGADIEAGGGVIADTPLADARAFRQFKTAARLVERGARVTLQDAATLGLLDRVRAFYYQDDDDAQGGRSSTSSGGDDHRVHQHPPSLLLSAEETDCALWNACHGGQLATAQFLFKQGGDVNKMPPWEPLTALGAARRSEADDVVEWLVAAGARED